MKSRESTFSDGRIPTEVISYSGYRGEEAPCSFQLMGREIEIEEIIERWVEEDALNRKRKRCFKVRGKDGSLYTLAYEEETMGWFVWGDKLE